MGSDQASVEAAGPSGCTAIRMPYRSLEMRPRWRLLLLNSMDGILYDRDGHGHIGSAQLRWLEGELQAASHVRQYVVLMMHQLLVDPTEPRFPSKSQRKGSRAAWADGGMLEPVAGPDWIATGDMIDNRQEVLELLARHPGVVKLSLHGHVHANTLAHASGVTFATLSSTSEYPMQWHELQLDECEARLLQRPLALPDERRLSENRDTRLGRNRIKLGLASPDATTMRARVVVRVCSEE